MDEPGSDPSPDDVDEEVADGKEPGVGVLQALLGQRLHDAGLGLVPSCTCAQTDISAYHCKHFRSSSNVWPQYSEDINNTNDSNTFRSMTIYVGASRNLYRIMHRAYARTDVQATSWFAMAGMSSALIANETQFDVIAWYSNASPFGIFLGSMGG